MAKRNHKKKRIKHRRRRVRRTRKQLCPPDSLQAQDNGGEKLTVTGDDFSCALQRLVGMMEDLKAKLASDVEESNAKFSELETEINKLSERPATVNDQSGGLMEEHSTLMHKTADLMARTANSTKMLEEVAKRQRENAKDLAECRVMSLRNNEQLEELQETVAALKGEEEDNE